MKEEFIFRWQPIRSFYGTVCRNTGWNIVSCSGGGRIQHAVFFWSYGGGKFPLTQKWMRGFFPVKITLVLTMTPLYRIHLHPLWKAKRARMWVARRASFPLTPFIY